MCRKHSRSIVLLICTFLLNSIPLAAQQEEDEKTKISERIVEEKQAHQDTTYQEPGTAFYLELGGKFFGSLNVDFQIKKSNRLSFGLVVLSVPNLMYFYLPGEKNSRLELGCGLTYNWLESETPVWIHGVLGYRYQKKKGFLFRAGFTPIIFLGKDSGFFPWIGISLGYSL